MHAWDLTLIWLGTLWFELRHFWEFPLDYQSIVAMKAIAVFAVLFVFVLGILQIVKLALPKKVEIQREVPNRTSFFWQSLAATIVGGIISSAIVAALNISDGGSLVSFAVVASGAALAVAFLN